MFSAIMGGVFLAGCAIDPMALDDEARLTRVELDFTSMFADQEPLSGPVDLAEAVARGLKYNLDKRLKMMELGLADQRLQVAHTELLPDVVATAGYRERDSFRGSSSRSLITGRESLEVSTSEDKAVRHNDLQLVWNVLDFGLTYLRVRQDADRVLIAEERRIKVVQNIILDIRDAFWRAAAAQSMLPKVDGLIAEIKQALSRSQSIARSGAGEPADELQRQRSLLEHLRDLTEVRRRLTLAKAELAALMNLPPSTPYQVAAPRDVSGEPYRLRAPIADLEQAALVNRPELREEDYSKRISLVDVDAAYVRLLPGIELRAAKNYDSNSFLLENSWQNLAGLLTKNLLELATAGSSIASAEQAVAVADARRLALSMAVIAQVHISLQRYALASDAFSVSAKLYAVDSNLSEISERGARNDATAQIEVLEARSRQVVSRLKYMMAYADMQNAYGRILNSVGAHRPPHEIEGLDVASLSGEVRNWLDDWQPQGAAMTVAYK